MEVGHADDRAEWVVNCSLCVSLVLKTETSLRLYHNSGGLGERLASPLGVGQVLGGWPTKKPLSLIVFVGSACCWRLPVEPLLVHACCLLMTSAFELWLLGYPSQLGHPPLKANPLYSCSSVYNPKDKSMAPQSICS